MSEKTTKKISTRKLTITALLFALIFVLDLSGLGFIFFLGFMKGTILHVPVIIGSVVEGPFVGAVLGLLFGLSSLWSSYARPIPISPAFHNPLVSVLPRILVGITPYFTYKFSKNILQKFKWNEYVASLLASVIGTLTNTVLVLSMIYLLSADFINQIFGVDAGQFLTTIGITNGPAEILLAAIVCTPIVVVLNTKVKK